MLTPMQSALPISEVPLFAEEQFHLMLNQIPVYSQEQEQELIERARNGEPSARGALIERCLRYITKLAYKYGSLLQHDDCLDLISEAIVAVTEKVDDTLINADNPISYLFGVAKLTILNYCRRHRSLISHHEAMRLSDSVSRVDSLDVLLFDDGLTLADTIAQPVERQDVRDLSEFYQAIDQLVPGQKSVLIRHYGLFESPAETFREIAQSLYPNHRLGSQYVYKTEQRALSHLRKVLDDSANDNPREAHRQAMERLKQQNTLAREQRLAQAYSAMVAEGTPICLTKLSTRAGVDDQVCRAWLSTHHPELCLSSEQLQQQRAVAREQRLAQAYSELLAEGVTPSAKKLKERAEVGQQACTTWLSTHHPELCLSPEQLQQQRAVAREQRLAQAYSELLAEGVTPSGKNLGKRAHVSKETAGQWLKERAGSEKPESTSVSGEGDNQTLDVAHHLLPTERGVDQLPLGSDGKPYDEENNGCVPARLPILPCQPSTDAMVVLVAQQFSQQRRVAAWH